mmetsp:Transcript_1111/g.2466  ORF Transcript_1111/g.2466 Transcript_1111/m.2466 type:complete len:209 (+) Transcript_1111:325-951(+)
MESHMATAEAVLCVGLDMYCSAWSVILSQPRSTSASSLRHRSASPCTPLSVRLEQSVSVRVLRDISMFSLAAWRPSYSGLNQKASSRSRNTSSRSRCCRCQQLEQTERVPKSDTRLRPRMLSDSRAGHVSAMQITPRSVRSAHMLMSRYSMPAPQPDCTMPAAMSDRASSVILAEDIFRLDRRGFCLTNLRMVSCDTLGHLFTFTCCS